ncbi:hypothetical protein C0Q70_04345 [Pomacea canaliculata]|uniref:Uncharacterized protein n=1 Tax=Pomacea canaliculata TaxID=400727 RepID=A0A2T7PV87_POMCA|nr:hypothetical protein C0Q70_04345 [Pomacea canaliculata]
MSTTAPDYLQEIVPPYQPSRSLHSGSQSRFCLPAVTDTNKKRTGARAFKHAAPKLWNALPSSLSTITSPTTFRKRLKTHLFLSNQS